MSYNFHFRCETDSKAELLPEKGSANPEVQARRGCLDDQRRVPFCIQNFGWHYLWLSISFSSAFCQAWRSVYNPGTQLWQGNRYHRYNSYLPFGSSCHKNFTLLSFTVVDHVTSNEVGEHLVESRRWFGLSIRYTVVKLTEERWLEHSRRRHGLKKSTFDSAPYISVMFLTTLLVCVY